MKKTIFVGKEEYHAGSKSLMDEPLQPVTRWVGSIEGIQFAINQLCSYRTKHVILRRQKKVVAKHIRQKKLVQKDIYVWEFALFRRPLKALSDESEYPPPPPRIPTYSAHSLQAMTADQFGAAITKIMRGEAKYRMPRGSSYKRGELYRKVLEELETSKVLDKDKIFT